MRLRPSVPSEAEPTKTHFRECWLATRERARRLPRIERSEFVERLEYVESAWPHVRSLQVLHGQNQAKASGEFARILDFIDDPVCDLSQDPALNVAVFIPVPGGGMIGDPELVDECTAFLSRTRLPLSKGIGVA